jgi:hypothetical protein
VVVVAPVEDAGVEVQPAMRCDGLEDVWDERSPQRADLRRAEGRVEDGVGPAAQVHHNVGERFVHGDPGIGQALKAALGEGDRHVLNRMMFIHVQVAAGLDGQVEQTVVGHMSPKVVVEADAGAHVGIALAVQVERDGHLGLVGLAVNMGVAGHGCVVLDYRLRCSKSASGCMRI